MKHQIGNYKPKLIYKKRVCIRCGNFYITENIRRGKVCDNCKKPTGVYKRSQKN